MALTQKAKQAKTLKKQQKRKLKLKQKSNSSNSSSYKLNLASVSSGDIHQCYIAKPNNQCPFYHVIISRINEENNAIVSVTFMINPQLTGIEDVYRMDDDIPSFYSLIQYNLDQGIVDLKQNDPAIGKQLILQAVTHAKALGHEPPSDYHHLKEIFFDVD